MHVRRKLTSAGEKKKAVNNEKYEKCIALNIKNANIEENTFFYSLTCGYVNQLDVEIDTDTI